MTSRSFTRPLSLSISEYVYSSSSSSSSTLLHRCRCLEIERKSFDQIYQWMCPQSKSYVYVCVQCTQKKRHREREREEKVRNDELVNHTHNNRLLDLVDEKRKRKFSRGQLIECSIWKISSSTSKFDCQSRTSMYNEEKKYHVDWRFFSVKEHGTQSRFRWNRWSVNIECSWWRKSSTWTTCSI